MKRGLKTVRLTIQLAVMTVITMVMMAGPTTALYALQGSIERWQLIPMSMLGAMSVVGVWLVVTLVLGRVYCSTVCPIGTLQDAAARAGRIVRPARVYRYKPGNPWFVRAAMLALLVMAMCFGSLAVSWAMMPFLQVSPYDSYSAMVDSLASPVADRIAGPESTPVAARIMISAAINMIFLVWMAAVRGREVCNTLCPVGAALGTVNTISLFHIDIDTDRCTHCRRCEYACKAMCIESDTGRVDLTRCVVCFDCLAVCDDDAIHYTTRRHRLSLPMLQSLRPASPSPRACCSEKTVTLNNLPIKQ